MIMRRSLQQTRRPWRQVSRLPSPRRIALNTSFTAADLLFAGGKIKPASGTTFGDRLARW